jgi:hypothetical protein
MPSPAGIDALLDRLVATTESLRDSARGFIPSQAFDLLTRRQQLASSLRSALENTSLTKEQRLKLERATEVGEEARQALLVKRETARGELQERLAGRQLNESFKPYRPKKPRRLNVKL